MHLKYNILKGKIKGLSKEIECLSKEIEMIMKKTYINFRTEISSNLIKRLYGLINRMRAEEN